MKLVVSVINQLRGENVGVCGLCVMQVSYSFYILLVPYRTQLAVQFLRDSKLYEFVTLYDLEINLIPTDNDLISMEITNSLSSIYLKHDYTPLKDIARAVLKLQVLYGAFRSFHSIGPLSRSVLNLMKELQPDDDSLSVDLEFRCYVGHSLFAESSDSDRPICGLGQPVYHIINLRVTYPRSTLRSRLGSLCSF